MELKKIDHDFSVCKVESENKIGIFVVSTYNTDYVLVKKENYDRVLGLLEEKGYVIAE